MLAPQSSITRSGPRTLLLRNWISLSGLVIATGSLFSLELLLVLNSVAHIGNPYIGILTCLAAPGFLITGLSLMSISNRVEYFASDKGRHKIPRVRLTVPNGVVTMFREWSFTNDVAQAEVRRMDCMECHNRPAHRYAAPSDAVNLAISLGVVARSLHHIKSTAVGRPLTT